LLGAAALVLLLALAAPRGGLSVVGLARVVLTLLLLGGTGWWLLRGRTRRPSFRLREPLQVLSRQGLSPRCGVALLDAEGQRFLVAYGEGFAQVQAVEPRRRTRIRRMPSQRGAPAPGGLQ
jgi:hypothetical protein